MFENDEEKLCVLLARKKKLLTMKETIERSTENIINNSFGSIIENSDTDTETQVINNVANRPNVIINSSTENYMQIENTDNQEAENSFCFLSKALEIIQDEQPVNIVTETATTNCVTFTMPAMNESFSTASSNSRSILILSDHHINDANSTNVSENFILQEGDVLDNETTNIPQNSDDMFGPGHSTSRDVLISDENASRKELFDVSSKRKRHVKSTFMKSCLDFFEEDEENLFSSGSSDLWSEKEISSDESEICKKSKARKKAKSKKSKEEKSQEESVPLMKKKPENKRQVRKTLREKGLAYETITGQLKRARSLQENPCKESKCIRKCYEISEERRQSLFTYFWSLNDEKKRDWIVQCCRLTDIKRKKTNNTASRRSLTYEYYINEGEGRRQVCQKFIIKTLDISQTYILYILRNAQEGLSRSESRSRTISDKYDEATKLNAKKYIEALPAVPSHYNRKKSTRLYLPEELKNTSNLYRLYVKYCRERSENYLSEKIFINMFKVYNYAFHVPKKDKCSLCTKNENNPDATDTELLQNHIMEKEATYKRVQIHQNLKPDDTLVVASFDLQKVLATPHGESMLLYYSRKYAVYNFTVYESGTKNGYCYTWGEADGKRGSCEIATCLYRYLQEVDTRGVKTLLMYCDNSSGQNKNKVILSMFKQFLEHSKNLQVIQINFLLVGHTYMQVDSMHAIIEREVKKLIVWAPSQWSTYMESARKRPQPYRVDVLTHSDFIDFSGLVDKIFTSATLQNLHMKNIRVCTFKKNNLSKIEVKYSMLENSTPNVIELSRESIKNQKLKGKGPGKRTSIRSKKKINLENENNEEITRTGETENIKVDNLPYLYKERLPISIPKYNDLKKLCDADIIPKRFHKEYLDLPNKMVVKDTLNETDEEDTKEEKAND